jgi:hypothetical protein
MTKIGIEGEFFVSDTQTLLTLVPKSLPHDSCGYLAEARGEAHPTAAGALALYGVAVKDLERQAALLNLKLACEAVMIVPAEVLRQARRLFTKGPTKYNNIYGLDYKPTDRTRRAGLHVHFSNTYTDKYYNSKGENYDKTINFPIDFPPIVQTLDRAFKDEIKASKRLPGFYEMKPYGFEYRSLPTNVDLGKLGEVLEGIRF